jgi:uncharacterized membrane protein
MWGWHGAMTWMAMIVSCIVTMVLMMRGGRPMAPRRRKDGSLYILRERFAAGEIDQQEYEDRKRLLSVLHIRGLGPRG